MRVIVFELGLLEPQWLEDKHGGVGDVLARWLGPALGPDTQWDVVSPVRGEALPSHGAADAFVLPGSQHGVHDGLPWIDAMRDWLRGAPAAGAPLFGICFGHQLMADAFGSTVRTMPTGLRIGMREVAWPQQSGPTRAITIHQDEVVAAPPGASATTTAYGVESIRYPFHAASVQFHPELTTAFLSDLMDARGPRFPSDRVAAARRELAAGVVGVDEVARWAASVLTPARSPAS